MTEATSISKQGTGWAHVPGIYTAEQVEGWKKVTEGVHAKGGVIFLQAWHMGRVTHSSYFGLQPVAPSAVVANGDGALGADFVKHPYEVPRALELDEIPAVIEEYRVAAENAKKAGFDGIELHSANGYFLDLWLQSKTNKREDKYGGPVENRFRFLKETIEAVSTVFPLDRIGVRLSPNGVFNDMGSPDNFGMIELLSLVNPTNYFADPFSTFCFAETFKFVIAELNKFGLAYLHLMDGLAFGFHGQDKVFRLADARKVYDGTIIGNCGYSKDTAEGAVGTGAADMIAFGRPYLSNPGRHNFASKAAIAYSSDFVVIVLCCICEYVDLVERFENNWPLADTLPYQYWYNPPYADVALGYSDQPAYVAPEK